MGGFVRRCGVLGLVCVMAACSGEGSSSSGGAAKGAGKAQAPTRGFAGTFRGQIQGTAATLTLEQRDGQLSGSIDAAGYVYTVSARIDGPRAQGTLTDPQTGGSMSFTATADDGAVTLAVVAPGQAQPMRMSFQRAGGAAPAPAGGGGSPASAPAGDQHDPRLVGRWRRTEQLGDPMTGTMLTVFHLVIGGDGSFVYGTDTDQQNGRWKSDGNIVYVSDGGAWTPYARFTTNGGSLLFTFGNGKKELWHRN